MTSGSQAVELIWFTGLIIWNEVPMQNKYYFEAVNCFLQDIWGNNYLFGRLLAILEGDWVQILPVVWHGNWVAIVQACFQRSNL